MKRILNLVVVATSAVVMASRQVDAAVVNVTKESTSCYTMTDGNTYVIQNSGFSMLWARACLRICRKRQNC